MSTSANILTRQFPIANITSNEKEIYTSSASIFILFSNFSVNNGRRVKDVCAVNGHVLDVYVPLSYFSSTEYSKLFET
jgi:hypothetical protein